MRTLFDTDEEEMEGKASEITLSTASLLGIFFGLVLVCGVFFGFGYSMGRGTGSSPGNPAPSSSAGSSGEVDEAAVVNSPAPPLAAEAKQQDRGRDECKGRAVRSPKLQMHRREDIPNRANARETMGARLAGGTPAQQPASRALGTVLVPRPNLSG